MVQKGKEFELAVLRFAQAINPSAIVKFNHFVPDRDTGTPRQCDVWIETHIAGHWPVTVNVSCKDFGIKLDISHIDDFIQETRSRGATMGVIYSRRGFNEHAIAKAKLHNISCCRLYDSQPADIPEVILSSTSLGCIRVGVQIETADGSAVDQATGLAAFRRLGQHLSSFEQFIEKFKTAESDAADPFNSRREAPDNFVVEHELPDPPGAFKLKAHGIWRFFRGRLESHLVNGSYNLTSNAFIGEFTTPAIATWGANPGDGWIEIEASEVDFSKGLLVLFFAGNSLTKWFSL